MQKTQKGFTLIELLIVIAIIGVLASVVIGAVGESREQAAQTSVLNSLRSAATVVQSCLLADTALSNQNTPPVAGTQICGGTERWPALPNGWAYGILIYDITNNYFWLRAQDSLSSPSRVVLCRQAPPTWSETLMGTTITGDGITNQCLPLVD